MASLNYNLRTRRTPGQVLTHNHVTHGRTSRNNYNGFQAFYVERNENRVVCMRGWRRDQVVHYKPARHNSFDALSGDDDTLQRRRFRREAGNRDPK